MFKQSILYMVHPVFCFIRFIPLHHAALSGNGEIVMGLLEFATDVNAKDKKG
jgi:hypothetical protein